MSDYLQLPKITDRITGQKYIRKNEIVIWDGKRFLCEHSVRREICKKCGGSSICEHSNLRIECKECGGSQICEHNRRKNKCKDCGGSHRCEHGRLKDICKECRGSQICEHDRRKTKCKECGGSSICEHGRERRVCRECEGSGICDHGKERRRCIACEGSGICDHGKLKDRCKTCNPNGYLVKLIRGRVHSALKKYSTRRDKKHTLEYVGCSVEYLRTYLENKFEKEAERCGHPISWENQGEWHKDHIRPCSSFNLDLEEERYKCFHHTNLQPMWGPDNIRKNDTYNEAEDKRIWNGRIIGWVG